MKPLKKKNKKTKKPAKAILREKKIKAGSISPQDSDNTTKLQ